MRDPGLFISVGLTNSIRQNSDVGPDLDLDSDTLATSYPEHFTSHVGENGLVLVSQFCNVIG